MADKPANKAKKRVVKNPETFRERALKASEVSDKPKRLTKFKEAGSKVSSPVGGAITKIGNSGPAKPFRRPLQLIGKILLITYVRNSWQELKQVKWPTVRQSRRLTFAVLIFAIIFGVSIAIVDYGLDKLFKDILLK